MQSYFNRKEAKKRNQTIDKTYYDNQSGLERNRPGLLKMLDEIKEIGTIYAYDQSRLTRSTEDLSYLIRVIIDNKINLVGTSSPIKIDTIEGRATTKIVGVIYEMEALKTGQRVRDNYESKLAESKKKGTKLNWGRPTKIKDKDFDKFVIQTKIVNKTELAKLLNVSQGTLYNYIRERFGKAISRKEMLLLQSEVENHVST